MRVMWFKGCRGSWVLTEHWMSPRFSLKMSMVSIPCFVPLKHVLMHICVRICGRSGHHCGNPIQSQSKHLVGSVAPGLSFSSPLVRICRIQVSTLVLIYFSKSHRLSRFVFLLIGKIPSSCCCSYWFFSFSSLSLGLPISSPCTAYLFSWQLDHAEQLQADL